MSEQASTPDHPAAGLTPSAERRPIQDGAAQPVRIVVVAAVCLGVAALAACAFVLSYAGIHAVARQAGISSQHARDYPVLIDAMLVIALLAVLGLRGAGLPSRILSWLALLCVLAAAAGADVLHATGRALGHTAGAATAAALPWALVFIAFVLLLALLRYARLRRQASVEGRSNPSATNADLAYADRPNTAPTAPSLPVRTPRPWDSASIVPGFSARLVSSAAAGAAAAAAEQPVPSDVADYGQGDRGQDDAILGLAGDNDTDTSAGAEPAEAAPADIDPTPADAPTQVADNLAEPGDPEPREAELADTDATPADAPTEVADNLAEPDEAEPGDPEPVDTDATPADSPAEPIDAAAAPADAAVEPDDPPAAEPDDPAAADSGVDAMPADTGSVDDLSAQDEIDTRGTGDPAAVDESADDDAADNMPVFHRMWSTPTPPDS